MAAVLFSGWVLEEIIKNVEAHLPSGAKIQGVDDWKSLPNSFIFSIPLEGPILNAPVFEGPQLVEKRATFIYRADERRLLTIDNELVNVLHLWLELKVAGRPSIEIRKDIKKSGIRQLSRKDAFFMATEAVGTILRADPYLNPHR